LLLLSSLRFYRPCWSWWWFTFCTVQWDIYDYQTLPLWLFLFCCRTNWLSNIGVSNSRIDRISDQGLDLSDIGLAQNRLASLFLIRLAFALVPSFLLVLLFMCTITLITDCIIARTCVIVLSKHSSLEVLSMFKK
jgi:hypothetical protein